MRSARFSQQMATNSPRCWMTTPSYRATYARACSVRRAAPVDRRQDTEAQNIRHFAREEVHFPQRVVQAHLVEHRIGSIHNQNPRVRHGVDLAGFACRQPRI